MSRYRKTMADAYAEVTKYSEEPEVVEAETVAETEPEEVEELIEVAPPGWEGTVKAMKKHKEIDNPYALSWHMKKKGFKSHKKEEVEIDELTPDQKKKREASRQRTHGGSATGGSDPFKRMFHSGQRGGKKPDRSSRQVWEPHPGKFKGPKGKLPEDIQMDDLANYDHHDYGFDTRADMVDYVQEKQDKPEQGKVYALTGRSDQPSIARGDSWKKSVVTKKRLKQDAKKESKLPPHLSKFLDKDGNPNKEAQARIDAGRKKRAEPKIKDVTPKGYGPKDEGSLSPSQKAAREKSRGRFGIGNRKHNNSPQAAHSLGFGTGGDHQNRGVKKARGAKPQGAYARTREEVESSEALDLAKIRAQRRAKGLKNLKKMSGLMRTIDKQQAATDGHGGYAPDDGRPAHPSPKGIGGDGPPGRPRGGKYKIHTKRIQKRYKDKALSKEALDTWHPDPEKDRKTTSMKHTAKAVRQHARRDKPATFAKQKVTPDQIRDILAKQRARKAAQNEAIQFKVKIKDLPAFYVPGKSAGQVKSALRKNLRHPEDIEAIDRVTDAGKKKDFRLRAQGKQ